MEILLSEHRQPRIQMNELFPGADHLLPSLIRIYVPSIMYRDGSLARWNQERIQYFVYMVINFYRAVPSSLWLPLSFSSRP